MSGRHLTLYVGVKYCGNTTNPVLPRGSTVDDVLEDAVAEVARLEGLAARDELHADVDGVPRISSLELLDRSIRGAGMGQG